MEESFVDPALDNARTWLRAIQSGFAKRKLPISKEQLRTDAALERLEETFRYEPTKVHNLVRRGAFRYDRDLENRRIALAQALIRRVEPGPFEDPRYFAILAYQAASVEMAYDFMTQEPLSEDLFSKVLLGTLHAPEVNAFARKETKGGYTIVMLNSGLVDFIYQAAKVIVEALNPSRSVDGRSAVTANVNLEAVRARLVSDPRPAERLYRTLEAYFFAGYPRASWGETIPEEHGPVLGIIVGLAERWVIGHEYGHGLAPSSAFEQPPPGVNRKLAEEYFADAQATIATVISAAKLDVVPPEFPLSAAVFALACLDLLQRAFYVLQVGNETGSDAESETHPKARDRATAIFDRFRQFFDVDYRPADRTFDLTFVVRSKPPEVHNFTSEGSKKVYAYANVLQSVWKPTKDRLLEDFRRKRPLHPFWSS